MFKIILCFGFITLLSVSCRTDNSTLFELLDESETGITFENKLQPATTDNILEYDYFYMGAGVAAADFDNDGRTDLYFSGNQVSGKLYLNKTDLKNGIALHFEDITDKAGLKTKDWCTGVAVADVNSDGWQDLYVCHAGLKNTPNQLFINDGQQPDGSIHFTEDAQAAGVNFKGFTTHAAFLDYDKDGDVDLYLLTHFHEKINPNYPKPKTTDGASASNDKLYQNDGKGHFTDVTIAAGIKHEGFGLGIAISDINADGWSDIYVSNDFAYDELLYINNKNGTFSERSHDYLRHTSRFSMGCDVADFNNDFYPDILTVDMMPDDNKRQKLMGIGSSNELFKLSLLRDYLPQYSRNMLQINNGDGSFSEIGQLAGIYKTDWSWSALFADLDNDGWKDIYITNGIPKDITNNDFTAFRDAALQMGDMRYETVRGRLLEKIEQLEPVNKPNFVFKNNGMSLTFSDQSKTWGLNTQGFSNGAVYADLDNDGDLDLVTNNLNAPAFVYRNRSEKQKVKNNFLRIKLQGLNILGTKIRVKSGGQEQFGEYNPYRGFQSSQEPFVHFGLGKATLADTIEIVWTNGQFQRLIAQKANQILQIKQQQANEKTIDFSFGKNTTAQKSAPFLTQSKLEGLDFQHQENEYEDFDNETLLPYRFSQNGPLTAVGDVNGDNLEDIWIGGSAKIAGKLFLQLPNGRFQTRPMPDPGFEDQHGLFFDADGDKDLDLYVVSGGNEYNPLTAAYQDRLYSNDGKGNFTRKKGAIPVEYASGKCVQAVDFDRDGDLDLFVGGRIVPNQYPQIPESFLFRNDGHGMFENVTAILASELQYAGMVTDAVWADTNKDGWVDLVVVGEFMPITVFQNNKGQLQKSYTSPQTGLWTCIKKGDFDNDGDDDFVVGNWGLNNKLNVSPKQPVSVYAVLFGSEIQPVLSYFNNGKEYPLAGRDPLVSRFPLLKKNFLTYSQFAEAQLSELFSEKEIAAKMSANYLASSYLENTQNNTFKLTPLPMVAQFSTITDTWIGDVDNDKNLDILAVGNTFAPDYLTGRNDASCGLLMLGNGHGVFKVQTPNQSGIHLKGDMKSLQKLNLVKQSVWIVGTNSMPLQVLRQNK